MVTCGSLGVASCLNPLSSRGVPRSSCRQAAGDLVVFYSATLFRELSQFYISIGCRQHLARRRLFLHTPVHPHTPTHIKTYTYARYATFLRDSYLISNSSASPFSRFSLRLHTVTFGERRTLFSSIYRLIVLRFPTVYYFIPIGSIPVHFLILLLLSTATLYFYNPFFAHNTGFQRFYRTRCIPIPPPWLFTCLSLRKMYGASVQSYKIVQFQIFLFLLSLFLG